jgi:hypothetical protein
MIPRMTCRIVAIAGLLVLGSCQGIVGPGGSISGLTVPPGCKAEGAIAFPAAIGSISFSCDETKVASPPATVTSIRLLR